MTIVDRRTLLRGAAAGAIVGGPFAGLVARAANAAEVDIPRPPLEPVADLRDGQVRLWLPRDFQYRSFHDTETPVTARRRDDSCRDGTTAWPPSAGGATA